jgi:hypothetical protein
MLTFFYICEPLPQYFRARKASLCLKNGTEIALEILDTTADYSFGLFIQTPVRPSEGHKHHRTPSGYYQSEQQSARRSLAWGMVRGFLQSA